MRKTPDKYCAHCGKILTTIQKKENKYCGSQCFSDHRRESYIKKWLSEDVGGSTSKNKVEMSGHIRNYLLEKANYKCSRCGWCEVNTEVGYPMLEIHHKDGNRANNTFGNLVVLCPNCHSITENYRALNIGKAYKIGL